MDRVEEHDFPRPRRRVLACLATSAVAGLGVVGPALASDLPPAPPVPVAPTPAPPAIPVPTLPPTLEEAVVVVTELDPETIDVSVRVLSPGEDASPENALIPPIPSDDTTAEADLDAAGSEEEAPSAETPAVNTNVSVRVLSPGSNGSTSDDDSGGGGTVATAGAAPASSEPDAAPAATTPSADTMDSSQYHDANSQYQLHADNAEEPWSWTWTLTVDCARNPTSSSIESGAPESLDWSWSWAWEWGCATGEAPKPEGASTQATQQPAPKAEPRPPPPPSEAQSSSGAAASEGESEPWSWTWTFTFCGQETTVTTLGGAGTPLTWTWDWSWVWSCEGAESVGEASTALPTGPPPAVPAVPTVSLPPPTSAATGSSSSQDATPGPETRSLQAVSSPFVTFSFDAGTGAATLELASAPFSPAEITVSVAIPPAISPISALPPVPLQVRPFPLGAAPLELGPHAAPVPGPSETSTTASTPASFPLPRTRTTSAGALNEGRPRPETKRKAEVKRARPDFRPALPLFLPSRHGAASTSASGAASSALLVGIVALTGFVLLAAPAPGRRLEVARELSPRGLDRSPLDHPG